MAEGLVFDINEFAVHDGPGVRTSVFLKGCPLRCLWCHNPEGQSFVQEVLAGDNGCLNCGKCRAVCRNNPCTACGACIEACPRNLRRFAAVQWESEQLASKLLRNRDILEMSGGGITFSGGEPLSQSAFLFAVARGVHPLHTAIETSGYASEAVFARALEEIDLIIMDIKHMDSEIHRQFIGVGNELIQKNLQTLLESGHRCILRVPVIPGVNDTEANMRATAERIQGFSGVERMELLAYHKTAGAKYQLTGRQYEYALPYEPKDVQTFCHIFEERGIAVFVP